MYRGDFKREAFDFEKRTVLTVCHAFFLGLPARLGYWAYVTLGTNRAWLSLVIVSAAWTSCNFKLAPSLVGDYRLLMHPSRHAHYLQFGDVQQSASPAGNLAFTKKAVEGFRAMPP